MAILGTLLKKGIILRESLEQQFSTPAELQKHELKKLLIHCKQTEFGQAYHFEEILKSFKNKRSEHYYENFSTGVPVHDYDKIYTDWWHKSLDGKKDITWPGKVKYFALSSGTSGAPSKHIPITKDMLKSIRKTSVRQMLSLSRYDLPTSFFTTGILMLGGSTDLRKSGHYFEGDLSGITTSQIPFWFQHFYKPGKRISKTQWDTKLDEITLKARDWDIGIIVGVPAWMQLLMEKITAYYKVPTIHDVWPNLSIFVHGGVPFEPYKKGFEKLLKKELIYMETYLASEGFLAFQAYPNHKPMRLVLNNGIYYEFIPFNASNFTEDGNMVTNPQTLKIDEVEVDKEYAVLITTNAGAWRYLIGDVIRFASIDEPEIIITGRTKLFLSLCGEHMSLDNINKAIQIAEEKLNVSFREFTVVGEPLGTLFTHRWYVGTDEPVDEKILLQTIDEALKLINDDYATERKHALKKIFLHQLPSTVFYNWMKKNGKVGGSHKFPRVLKKEKAEDWKSYVSEQVNL